MPKKLEQQLEKQAARKGLTGDRKNAYVYGTLRRVTSWTPGQDKTPKSPLRNVTKV